MPPTVAFDVTSPAGSQSRALGDDRIREFKQQMVDIISADHVMSASGSGATWGYHNKVTFVEQGSSPSMVANTIMLFAKEVSSKTELFMDSYDATNSEMQLTSNGNWIGAPIGAIIMWSGALASIPTGWALCDGTSSTPNLVGKFIRGINTSVTAPGTTGGADTKTIAIANLPSHDHGGVSGSTNNTHTHTGTTVSNGNHTHTTTFYSALASELIGDYPIVTPGNTAAEYAYTGTTSSNGAHTHTFTSDSGGAAHTHTVSAQGSGTALDIRPAYYELAFIIKT